MQGLRILAVDDEAALRRLLQAFLTRLGHSVQTCSTGEEALGILAENGSGFDLVVADLTLPGLSGEALIARIFETVPDVRILVCSGWPFSLEELPPALRGRTAFVQKPFLGDMLQQALDQLCGPGTR